jgi:hypothetical protein
MIQMNHSRKDNGIKTWGTCKEKGRGMKIHKSAIVHPNAVLGN